MQAAEQVQGSCGKLCRCKELMTSFFHLPGRCFGYKILAGTVVLTQLLMFSN